MTLLRRFSAWLCPRCGAPKVWSGPYMVCPYCDRKASNGFPH